MKRWKKSEVMVAFFLVLLGLLLRLYPGRDHFLWNNSDYGRDVYEIKKIISDRDMRLLGPKASVFDRQQQAYLVFNGPIFYYFLAPFYFLSKGDPNVPLIANILHHLTILIPIGWLSWRVFKHKAAVFLMVLLSAISYEFIEYSRWLLNPAFALPFLAWFYLSLHVLYTERRMGWVVGLSLGLAIQNQIFLLYWLLPVFIILVVKKMPWKQWLQVGGGLLLGLAPLVLAEIMFRFRATQSLLSYLLESHPEGLSVAGKVGRYVTHINIVAYHQFWGFTENGGWIVVGLLLLIPILGYRRLSSTVQSSLPLLYLLFFSHAVIYGFHFYESIYTDVGLGVLLLFFVGVNLSLLWSTRWRWFVPLILLMIIWSQLRLLVINTHQGTPFSRQFFLASDTLLFSDRLQVVAKLYEASNGEPFSISVLDTPYGWPAVWSVVFEQYQARNGTKLPTWYGFHVNGVPGDKVFQYTDVPRPLHFVLKQKIPVIDEGTQQRFSLQQDQVTKLEQIIEMHNAIIEQRSLR